ncbi:MULTISPECIES: XRE family transcriptional regulator [unclassified Duganella]|jgi:phage repressor protein C with HTH and peptisase S24 domain|uniref:XRE family transcriptional regulator n=1 Tax=unclassified Duganella TaxID=2636909 RepID=UPI000884BAF6|nr:MULTISPECIES: XRE family transcriptional regulator [unclassified Duganella]SDH41504.1 Phage repressor protein C, contains Cro/C1-type HTH and peptisase s24 domains [Duganella sp. OV458]SDK60819.1 Phage repressor protein C, contains Cro/C1-type HTH and peptisase s24 domains [Duganella sp. OV510]
MNWNERITQARTAKSIKKVDLARQLGVSPATITQWESGITKEIKGANLTNLCAALGVDPSWLLNGDGDGDLARALVPGAKRVVVADDDASIFYQIPKVKLKLQAGITGIQTEPDPHDGGVMAIPRRWADSNLFNPHRLIAVQVRGESMEPTFYDGDTVIINLDDTKLVDNHVYAVNYEGEAVLKRMVRDVGQWWLASDNTDQRKYHRKQCRGVECIVVGRVVRREGTNF